MNDFILFFFVSKKMENDITCFKFKNVYYPHFLMEYVCPVEIDEELYNYVKAFTDGYLKTYHQSLKEKGYYWTYRGLEHYLSHLSSVIQFDFQRTKLSLDADIYKFNSLFMKYSDGFDFQVKMNE